MKILTRDRATSTEALVPFRSNSAASLDGNSYDQHAFDSFCKLILSFGEYVADWDGQGAAAPSPKLIENALNYLTSIGRAYLLLPHDVSLTADGTIVFEWKAVRFLQFVEISDSGKHLTVIDTINKTSHTTRI